MSRLQTKKTPVDLIRESQVASEELKLTAQNTSSSSGVLTYQIPSDDSWDVELQLPTTAGNNFGTIEVITTYDSEFQDHPVFYPYLTAEINGNVWHPVYSPSLGLGFRSDAGRDSYIQSFEYLQDVTTYSEKRSTHKFVTVIYYKSSTSATLRLRFAVRSTDKGSTNVQTRIL